MVELLIAFALVAANGFFVASEFAIARIRDTQVAEVEALGKPGAGSLRHAVTHIDSYLAACQLGITLASIGLGFVGKPAFEELLKPLTGPAGGWIPGVSAYALSFGLAYFIVTVLHVVLGELAPKSLAIARTPTVSLALAPPMRAFYFATKPLVDFFNALGNLVLKPFGIPTVRESGHTPHSEDELRMLLRQSEQSGVIEPSERRIAESAFQFSERTIRDTMTPRHSIVALPFDATLREAAMKVVEGGHSRLPVFEALDTMGSPVGYVSGADLLAATLDSRDSNIASLLRPVTILPEAMPLVRAMKQLQDTHQPMALVTDEYGSVSGLVSIEDMVEQVFGEIYDETDTELDPSDASAIQSDGHGGYLVPGDFPSVGLEDFGIRLPPGRYSTVGGFVMATLESLPPEGTEFDHDGWTVSVESVQANSILSVRFRPTHPTTTTSAASPE